MENIYGNYLVDATINTLLTNTGFTWASTAVAVDSGTGTCYDCTTITNCKYCTSDTTVFNTKNDATHTGATVDPVNTPYCYSANPGYQVTATGTVRSKYTKTSL